MQRDIYSSARSAIWDLFISFSSRNFQVPSWPWLILFSRWPVQISVQIPSMYTGPRALESHAVNDLYRTFQIMIWTPGGKHSFTCLKGAEWALASWKASELGSVHPTFFRQKWKEPWNGNGCIHAWLPRWITDSIRQSLVRISKGDFAHKRTMDTCWHLSGKGHVSAIFHF